MPQPLSIYTEFEIQDRRSIQDRMFELLMVLDDLLGEVEKMTEALQCVKDDATDIWEEL